MTTILIAGGYGAVGSKIAQQLADRKDTAVIIAGRSLEKARAEAKAIGAEARMIDLRQSASWAAALEGVDLVVTCIDQTDTAFLQTLGEHGIACVDVTADDAFFRKAEALDLPTTAVFSVGLAPGLSNLLAIAAARGLDHLDRIEIGILMGTGDEHGTAAIAWSMAQMFDPDAPRDDAVMDFGPDFGRRRAYFMNFADQHVLRRTLPGTNAITRVAYDRALLTTLLFWVGRRFAGNRTIQALFNRISHLPLPGSDKCVLSIRAHGQTADRPVLRSAMFQGRREAAVTAAMAVAVADTLLSGPMQPGVHHAHQIVDADTILARIEQWGHGTFTIGPIESAIVP
ncbi:saccharopine dehydrogenase NADP-binding domain-containing protein [Devosia marina]|uniref:NAD(P)H-binding protein n=1 Tax=Devosia marina TaxID=2683198 RepID=A0A7X3FPR5_9HYPH|nr:saccharopine dehydrogenase NADP-binding domain-containing protein [Devosia marina]MVS98519.1 NAD(P)H-binding protein [Devosia marina]